MYHGAMCHIYVVYKWCKWETFHMVKPPPTDLLGGVSYIIYVALVRVRVWAEHLTKIVPINFNFGRSFPSGPGRKLLDFEMIALE